MDLILVKFLFEKSLGVTIIYLVKVKENSAGETTIHIADTKPILLYELSLTGTCDRISLFRLIIS